MKTIKEVLNNYKDYETPIDDRFGVRFCQFLTAEQMEQIGFSLNADYKDQHKPQEWTRENILTQLEKDVEFGFEKALDKRGISSNLMFSVVNSWNKILEEGLQDWDTDNYAQYGLPLFKATAIKYEFPNPIGDDNGNEFIYSSDYEEEY